MGPSMLLGFDLCSNVTPVLGGCWLQPYRCQCTGGITCPTCLEEEHQARVRAGQTRRQTRQQHMILVPQKPVKLRRQGWMPTPEQIEAVQSGRMTFYVLSEQLKMSWKTIAAGFKRAGYAIEMRQGQRPHVCEHIQEGTRRTRVGIDCPCLGKAWMPTPEHLEAVESGRLSQRALARIVGRGRGTVNAGIQRARLQARQHKGGDYAFCHTP